MIAFDDVLTEAAKMPVVPEVVWRGYRDRMEDMVETVDRIMADDPGIGALTGFNPMQGMFDNHLHHARFMGTVLRFSRFQLLVRTVPWVYRVYHARQFSYDYFEKALKAWRRAAHQHLDSETAEVVCGVYDWMISRHREMVSFSRSGMGSPVPIAPGGRLDEVKRSFLSAILRGDHREGLSLARQTLESGYSLEQFYLQVVQQAMYELGCMWEYGDISVAVEHLASSVVVKVITSLFLDREKSRMARGRAVITTAPGEYHEVGGWMVADLLEMDGWDVMFLGSNTPIPDLLEMVRKERPGLLGLSLSIPFHLDAAADIITHVRDDAELDSVKVLVGGLALCGDDELGRILGADGQAADACQAVHVARQWAS